MIRKMRIGRLDARTYKPAGKHSHYTVTDWAAIIAFVILIFALVANFAPKFFFIES